MAHFDHVHRLADAEDILRSRQFLYQFLAVHLYQEYKSASSVVPGLLEWMDVPTPHTVASWPCERDTELEA